MNKNGHLGFAGLFTIPLVYEWNKIDINFNYELVNYKITNTLNNLNLMYNEWYYFCIFIFLIIIGAKFPDIDLLWTNQKTGYKTHRQFTHSLLLFIIFIGISIYYENIYLLLFLWGILSHLIADMLTGTIPIFLYGPYYQPQKFFTRIGIDNIFFFMNIKKLKNFIVKLGDKHGIFVFLISIFYVIYKYMILHHINEVVS